MAKTNIKNFEKKIVVRNMKYEDFPQVIELEKRCFPDMKPWTVEHLESHLNVFPEGQFVIVLKDKIVASCSSLIIEFDEYKDGHSWNEISGRGYIDNHDPEGDTLYGIEIMVDTEFRGMKLSRRLYDARKELCVRLNLKRIVIGGRIPGYEKHSKKMTAREYVEKVLSKRLYDTVLTAQIANGFTLKRLIRSYLKDQKSDDWATLLEWVNLDYKPVSAKQYLTSRPVRICVIQYLMRNINNFEEFAQQCEYFVDVASGYRSSFLLFPEIFTSQIFSFMDAKRPELAVRKLAEYTPQYLELFSNLSVKYNINVIGGSHFTEEEDSIYNIAYLFKRNGEICKQYKLHITPSERIWWGIKPGNKIEVFDTDCGKISIQICYDIEFPEVSRIAVGRGARIIFVPFCTDERHGYLRVRYCAQARCIENQVYAALAGTVGNLPFAENMDIQYAQSAILTPSDFAFSRDAIGAECTPNIETLVINDVDLELLERYRKNGTVLNWQHRRSDLYEVIIK